MVHALDEIRRVLIPGGTLVDLRPLADRWLVEVVRGNESLVTGRLNDLPSGLADDVAADQAMVDAARRGWFGREQEQFFHAFIYWDDPEEMYAHIKNKWTDFVSIDEQVFQTTCTTWAQAGKNKRVRLRAKMFIACWRKL